MKTVCMFFVISLFCLLLNFVGCKSEDKPETNITAQTNEPIYLIDDFTSNQLISKLNTKWKQATDQVMGGISTASHSYEKQQERNCIRLKGNVSLENNGGFIQIALPLEINKRPFDASSYKGIRLTTMGNNHKYYVHLRHKGIWFPWQFYQAEFYASDTWQTIDIPFSKFNPVSLKGKLKTNKLIRIAIVAFKEEFKADVAISRLEFYR